MPRIVKLFVLALSVAVLSACGVPGQTVTFKPEVKAQSSNLGRGRHIALTVQDDRPDKVIGYRDMDMSKNAPIREDGDLKDVVGMAAMKALSDLGFSPVKPSENPGRSLTITIRDLSYSAKSEGVTKKVSAKTTLAGKAKNGPGTWEGSFPVRQEKDVVMTPDENSNARFINEVLSESLSLLLSDPDLQQFLAKDGVQSKVIKQD